MNKIIHERLIEWSEAVKGGVGVQGYGSMFNAAVGDSVRVEQGCRVPFSLSVEETEKAVQSLPDALKKIVIEFYVNDSSTLEQKLKALGISKRTLYRRLDNAHGMIAVRF